MGNIRLLAAAVLSLVCAAAAAEDETGCEWYVQGAAQMVHDVSSLPFSDSITQIEPFFNPDESTEVPYEARDHLWHL